MFVYSSQLILMVCLIITIRLHFSLKDDEENNQFILDLAVYRSDLLFMFPLHFCHYVLIHRIPNIILFVMEFQEENKYRGLYNQS